MKIGIVNDQRIAVEILRRVLMSTQRHQIVWTAGNGAEAVKHCARDKPDLVLMDLIMPEMDGVEATRLIMMNSPCPILVVTASIESNISRVYNAMGYGAIDAIDTPVIGTEASTKSAAAFLAKIENIGKVAREKVGESQTVGSRRASGGEQQKLLVIGASAGGPGALATVLSKLPPDFSAATIIVQHINEQFAPGMSQWLSQHSSLPVRTAKDGDTPAAGSVLLASTSDHLIFSTSDRLGYTPEPRDVFYRPSVDVFFQSVSRLWRGDVIGVILTGMGRDGAVGLKQLRDDGHYTIAQDQATSVVYGMPKAAAAINAAVDILSLDKIAPKVVEVFKRKVNKRDAYDG